MFANICSALLLLAGIILSVASNDRISCRDENGEFVDWYYLYKLPASHQKQPINIKYLYLSAKTVDKGWQLSSLSINDSKSFPASTLAAVEGNKDVVIFAYNDEAPDGRVNNELGHTKGVLAADAQTGFWLIHSVPKYPNIGRYEYPVTGSHFGQSFLCLSLNSNQMDLVGKQVLYNEPNIYYSQISEAFSRMYPNLAKLSHEEWNMDPPYWRHQVLETIEGVQFESFSKGRKFQKELYEDWIAPTLNTNLLVETWKNGAGAMSTNCTHKQRVMNVKSISSQVLDIDFKSTKDHSKWCVSEGADTQWICVGDINRMEHQLIRGGGTVCQANKKIATAYRNLVADVEPCPKSPRFSIRNYMKTVIQWFS